MKLNPEKCKEMIVDFLQYNATKWQPIYINDKQVQVVIVFKRLGVYPSSDLAWTVHCALRVHYKESQQTIICLKKIEEILGSQL